MTAWRSIAVAAFVLAAAACSPAPVPQPSISPTRSGQASPTGGSLATASGSLTVESTEAAAALVLAMDPRFAGIGPLDPDLVGACCSWTAVPTADGWTVTIEIGWGDCPAGCIERHRWVYEVSRLGAVTLRIEEGPPLPGGGGDETGLVGIRGAARAGPICPVALPNDPACAPRPVAGATIHVIDGTGTEVAQLETDARGEFQVTIPAGRYVVRADPMEGLMRAPDPVEVEVTTGLVPVELTYDTGIR